MKKEFTRKELELFNDSLNRIKSTNTHSEYLFSLYAIADMVGIVYKELEENKSVIRDMLGDYITRSEIIDLYHSMQECKVGKENFVSYLMGILEDAVKGKCVKN